MGDQAHTPSFGTPERSSEISPTTSLFHRVRRLHPRDGPERASDLSIDTQHSSGPRTSELRVQIPEPGTEPQQACPALPGSDPLPAGERDLQLQSSQRCRQAPGLLWSLG